MPNTDPFNGDQDSPPIELIFGFVGPTGVDIDSAVSALQAQLTAVGYESHEISLSKIILNFQNKLEFDNDFDRITSLIKAGNSLRSQSKDPSIVARMGIYEIRRIRHQITGSEETPHKSRGVAYIVRSFKRPEEVALYRDVYGKAFTLISLYAPKPQRVKNLTRRIQCGSVDRQLAESYAVQLVNRDNKEEGEQFGQRVGETFPTADFFASSGERVSLETQLRRLVRLTFGDPYISPTRDEEGMFLAQAAALRSLDLSRQVGAAIISDDGEVISTGCNEVPKAGGGLYWSGGARDYEVGFDANAQVKKELIEDAYNRLRSAGQLSEPALSKSDRTLATEALFGDSPHFRRSLLFDVIEFGRAVHAEMAAITQAAKRGVPTQGARMFSTTFPCHICARHIVSSGVREVVFVEPYEKSRTAELFSDSIAVEPPEPSTKLVNFHAFVGVAPRRYIDFFQSVAPRKNIDGTVLEPEKIAKYPRVRRMVLAYTLAEDKSVKEIAPNFFLTAQGDGT